MRLGIDVAQHQLTWAELRDRVCFAEEVGFEGAWLFDHFQPLYGDPHGPCLEAWTLLAALAAVTSRIRLGVLVTGMTYRHPSLLAAEAVTCDHVSAGRLDLAVGAAWFEGEHRALGFDFPPMRERAERLEEGIEVMRALMTQDRATFHGRHYHLEDATYRPRPVQHPHPPMWVGASGERLTLPIVGRQADAWHCFGSPQDLARKAAVVEEHARRAGRDPARIVRATNLSLSQPWDEVRRTARALRDVGVSYLVASWPEAGRSRVEEFVREVMPELLAL